MGNLVILAGYFSNDHGIYIASSIADLVYPKFSELHLDTSYDGWRVPNPRISPEPILSIHMCYNADLEGCVLDSLVGSDPAATTSSSTLEDIPSLIKRAIAKLSPDHAAQVVDKKRKAISQDPGWKYEWWPDPSKKDFVQCIFCRKVVPAGICRFKQHLAGGYGDAIKCPNTPAIVRRR